MDVFPKFIIETDPEEGDCLIVAKCTYHKQLVTDLTKVKGGGWWSLDRDKNIFTLHGESSDFGRAGFEDIKNCVEKSKVFSSSSLLRNLVEDGFKFQYRNECGEIFKLNYMKNTNGIINIATILTVVSLLCVLVFKICKAIFFGVIALFKNLIDQDWWMILILIVAILLELCAMLLISKKLNRE